MHDPLLVERRPETGARKLKPPILIGAAAVVGLAAGIAAWLWLGREPPTPAVPPTTVETPPAPLPEPVRQPAAPPAAPTPAPEPAAVAEPPAPLPALDASDAEVASAAVEVIGPQARERILRPDDLVRRAVLTIDSLPRRNLSLERRSVQPMPGAFVVRGAEDAPFLSEENFQRYAAFTTLVSAIDAGQIVALYRHYYPLLQQAYLELGNPDTDFNARVIDVIDHLLEAPSLDGPIALTRPNVLYEYADPAVEALSSGHKILVRMGPINAAVIEAKLREIRALLAR